MYAALYGALYGALCGALYGALYAVLNGAFGVTDGASNHGSSETCDEQDSDVSLRVAVVLVQGVHVRALKPVGHHHREEHYHLQTTNIRSGNT